MELAEFARHINQEIEKVRSMQDLKRFIALLTKAYEDGYFEEQPVPEYLGGLYGACEHYSDTDERLQFGAYAPWRLIADMLVVGFVHS